MKIGMTAPFDINFYMLDDWLKYHSNIGVDYFLIYSLNNNSDIRRTIKQLWGKYKMKFVEINLDNYKSISEIRNIMANDIQNSYKVDWILSNDSDEFYYLSEGQNLKTFIKKYETYNAFYFERFNVLPFINNTEKYISPAKSYKYLVNKPIELSVVDKSKYEKIEIEKFLLKSVNGKMFFKSTDLINIDSGSHQVLLKNPNIFNVNFKEGFICHYQYSTYKNVLNEQLVRTSYLINNPILTKPAWHRVVINNLILNNNLDSFFKTLYCKMNEKNINTMIKNGYITHFSGISDKLLGISHN